MREAEKTERAGIPVWTAAAIILFATYVGFAEGKQIATTNHEYKIQTQISKINSAAQIGLKSEQALTPQEDAVCKEEALKVRKEHERNSTVAYCRKGDKGICVKKSYIAANPQYFDGGAY